MEHYKVEVQEKKQTPSLKTLISRERKTAFRRSYSCLSVSEHMQSPLDNKRDDVHIKEDD